MQWTDDLLERHSRQIILPEIGIEGVEAFAGAKILLVGLGGLGSPAALYLASAGVGTLGLADFDAVSLSNMQRQILYGEADVGKPKVKQARQKLQSLNSNLQVVEHREPLSSQNALAILADYDYVIEGSDNFATKYLINDTCVLLNKPFSLGGILKFEGQLLSCVPHQSGCYRCLFPEPPAVGTIPTCAEAGILGPVAGIVGSMLALEALKHIASTGGTLLNRCALYDFRNFENRTLKFTADSTCPICGQHASSTLLDYEFPACPT